MGREGLEGLRGSAQWTEGPTQGCDEFTVGSNQSDTHSIVLREEDGAGGCLPGGPEQAGGRCGG